MYALNKGELLHPMAMAYKEFAGRRGLFHECDGKGEFSRATRMSLISVWTTCYLIAAFGEVRWQGMTVNDRDLPHPTLPL